MTVKMCLQIVIIHEYIIVFSHSINKFTYYV